MDVDLGTMNPHVVGTLMKEAVRRAIVAIRGHRFTFEAMSKRTALGKMDFVTTADHAAQRVFIKLLREWFPQFGIVAEEGDLAVPSQHGSHDIWFTVDPLDGTQAFIRRQSHGIGTMIALVVDGHVAGACVGDVMTQEIYAARPGADTVHRISEFGTAERLTIDPDRTLASQWLMLRGRVDEHVSDIRAMVSQDRPLFAGVLSSGGSIGIAMARLWKGEVGGAVMGPIDSCTPWDLCPVVGLCERLGFVFYEVGDGALTPWVPVISKGGTRIERPLLIVHESRLDELTAWFGSA